MRRFFFSGRTKKNNEVQKDTEARVWAIGGGKGGVGKSFLVSNIGVLLAERSKRVLLVDADFGAANLHTFFGVENSAPSILNFLKGEARDLKALITPTTVPGLDLVTGARDSLDAADIKKVHLSRLGEVLTTSGYDYVILDTGPGTSSRTVELLFNAHEALILTTPEPTALENTYRYIKCLILSRIKRALNSAETTLLKRAVLDAVNEAGPEKVKTVADMMVLLGRRLNGDELREALLGQTTLRLIVNQARYEEDAELGGQITELCRYHLSLDVGYVGCIGYDVAVADSIRDRRPLAAYRKDLPLSRQLNACLDRLMNTVDAEIEAGDESRGVTGA